MKSLALMIAAVFMLVGCGKAPDSSASSQSALTAAPETSPYAAISKKYQALSGDFALDLTGVVSGAKTRVKLTTPGADLCLVDVVVSPSGSGFTMIGVLAQPDLSFYTGSYHPSCSDTIGTYQASSFGDYLQISLPNQMQVTSVLVSSEN